MRRRNNKGINYKKLKEKRRSKRYNESYCLEKLVEYNKFKNSLYRRKEF